MPPQPVAARTRKCMIYTGGDVDTGFAQLAIPAWEIVVRSAVIYLALLIGLRLFGKREIGQFTLFDLVVVLELDGTISIVPRDSHTIRTRRRMLMKKQ